MMPKYLKIARHPKDYDGKLLDAVRAERDELEAIVRALAKTSPSYVDGNGEIVCPVCEELVGKHNASCPYRRAVEWCEQHKEVK